MDWQQPQAWELGNVTLDVVGISNGNAKHLIATTDADNGFAVTMGADYGLCAAVSAQFKEVVECCLRTWQDDDVGTLDVGSVVGIKKIYARVALQCVEVSEVRNMA